MCIISHNQRNDSGDHSLKRESMYNSWVSKGTEKRILFLGTGITGQGFSNQADKRSCRIIE
jgi:hypothetical protein